ncbi:Uncharacterized secreted protein [Neisseria animaloris]|uniref:Csu type fimbrial protein n=1 Tax=Neisseria animaloris TaxID=326522 RepID=UPI000A197F7B|nr:spore coat U domain-containing protein [Neisseria animaloris]OSI07782.1 hypothetical protein BWD08_06360 [Neisseria animaloris]VEH88418.1 Uncharacterized secreted protein [Neisseria animaloris]
MHTVKKLSTLTSIMAASLCSGAAIAATQSADFHVTIRILPVCEVTTSTGGAPSLENSSPSAGADINFGEYASNHKTEVDKQSIAGSNEGIQVRCSKGTPYQIALTPESTSDNAGAGNMKGLGGTAAASDQIAYTLYKDNARREVWGNQQGSNTLSGSGQGIATTIKHPVYGRVLGTELDKTAGRYSDRVNVTVHY